MNRAGIKTATLAAALTVALGLVVGACSPAVETSTDETEANADAEAAIADFNRRYLAAINDGDIDALASLTTDDHMMIASGGEPLTGKAALVQAMTGAFERFDLDESWTPLETVVTGDLAYQRGTFVVNATPRAGGDATRTTGNFLRIYRRQADGRWFMVRDMFNSD